VLVHDLLARAAARAPDRPAAVEPGRGALSWAALDRLSDRVRDRLCHLGVRPGDRVGLCLAKSGDALASVYGTLKAGAAYVPVDPDGPPPRCALIFADCAARAVVTERRLAARLREALDAAGSDATLLVLDGTGAGVPLGAALDDAERADPAPPAETVRPPSDALAYVLYTSGSTGRPKGVMLTHAAATSFVHWCSATFAPTADDRFASHAPLHFDLSILDLYVSAAHAAAVVLIGEELGKDPQRLAATIAEERITVWYSTPSILALLGQYGKLERHDHSALRLVLFAGEVFPVPRLRELTARWPAPRYFNLYGPTETNVCTYHEVRTPVPPERAAPYPIGRACEHLRARAVDADGATVAAGEEGELVVSGPGVMTGYWNLPERDAAAFLVDAAGARWYRTGDLVVLGDDGDYVFRGRRDRMVKRRGYRIELGEIEAGLALHPEVREVAVVAGPAADGGVRITATLSLRGARRPSLIELRQFSVDQLPRYMVPDHFVLVDAIPRTSTDKVDYQALAQHAATGRAPAGGAAGA
jgi:amino acid adenylation domain-containing protein